ncbi:MAG: prolipoprotein diacylglyceryl transferase [Candidatus Rokubacteria bacterium]|nr:prolipoprotein diacylglyceryl transferase [Candidatus Rokubacteria bacterium]
MFRSPGAIAFQVGPLTIRWYGILMAAAILVGFWLADREAKREGINPDKLLNAGQWAVIAGLIGARLYEVVFNWDYYGRHLSKIPAVWEGGLAIHGGLILGILVGLWVGRREGLPILRCLDVVAPSLAIGQAIGRWGNFFNEEAFGTPTSLPWKLYVSAQNRPLPFASSEYFHPTFLYESLWDLGVFVALIALRRRLVGRSGAVFFVYIGLYSVGRFLIESIRLDSFWLGPFRVPQLASVAGVGLAVAGLLYLRSHRRVAA